MGTLKRKTMNEAYLEHEVPYAGAGMRWGQEGVPMGWSVGSGLRSRGM